MTHSHRVAPSLGPASMAAAGFVDDWEVEYESELARIDHSGPHEIGDEQRALNRAVAAELADLLPIDDIHKVSDCDLIYRFLIAHRWHVQKAGDAVREYAAWRAELGLNNVLWEKFPDEVMEATPFFRGTDVFGFPLFFNRPDPAKLMAAKEVCPRDEIVRCHLMMMEQSRRVQVATGVDRCSCILDMSQLSFSLVTNPFAIGLLKEMSTLDQKWYPENLRTMVITNAGFLFGTIFKVVKPLLDVRVQKKLQIMPTSPEEAVVEAMSTWVDLDRVPTEYGGRVALEALVEFPCLVVDALPEGAAPLRPGEAEAAAAPSAKLAAKDSDMRAPDPGFERW